MVVTRAQARKQDAPVGEQAARDARNTRTAPDLFARLPQELRDIVYSFVFDHRELRIHPLPLPGKERLNINPNDHAIKAVSRSIRAETLSWSFKTSVCLVPDFEITFFALHAIPGYLDTIKEVTTPVWSEVAATWLCNYRKWATELPNVERVTYDHTDPRFNARWFEHSFPLAELRQHRDVSSSSPRYWVLRTTLSE